jgi:peroxiredoxin
MVSLGTKAPDFTLPDTVSGKQLSLAQLKGNIATVIMFICNHCPFVKHVNQELVNMANDHTGKGISFIAISSNDATAYPDDGPDKMKQAAANLHYPFPYLYDESQAVAKTYQAACTPDFFIYDHSLQLVYRGQLDDSRPGNGIPVTGKDIRQALDQLIKDQPVAADQKPAIGCSIKWKL